MFCYEVEGHMQKFSSFGAPSIVDHYFFRALWITTLVLAVQNQILK